MTSAADPPRQPTTRAPVDESVLDALVEELGDGDRTVLDDLIDSYLTEASEQIVQFETAVRKDDAPTVAAVAHSLKSASALLGAAVLADLLQRAERTAK